MKRWIKGSLVLLTVVVLWSPIQASAVKKSIQVALHRNRIQDMSSAGLLLDFIVKISNSSSARYFLSKYDYRAVVGQSEYLRLSTELEAPIAIEPKGEMLVALPLKITYALLFQEIPGLENKTRIGCSLSGVMVFADERKREEKIPFTVQGEIPVFKDPEVRLSAVRVKNMTVGGADLVLGFSLVNKNDFDLEVGVLNCKLDVGGRTLLESSVQGPLALAPAAEKTFAFPLLLDFFEIGNQVSAVFQHAEADVLLTGGIEAETVWGPVRIPISKRAKVPVEKSVL